MKIIDVLHGGYVHSRRVRMLAQHLAELLPPQAEVLDVGCGDGLLASLVQQRRPDVRIKGMDVMLRPATHIEVGLFDGQSIPCGSSEFDVTVLVDVIHHIEEPIALLREAVRVSRRSLIIKDHTMDGWLADETLRIMDYVGNARHGVALPHNYWPEAKWKAVFVELGLGVADWRDRLQLYPAAADWIFGRRLHFLARLDILSRANRSSDG